MMKMCLSSSASLAGMRLQQGDVAVSLSFSPSVGFVLSVRVTLCLCVFGGESGDQWYGVSVDPGASAGSWRPHLLQPSGPAGVHGPSVVRTHPHVSAIMQPKSDSKSLNETKTAYMDRRNEIRATRNNIFQMKHRCGCGMVLWLCLETNLDYCGCSLRVSFFCLNPSSPFQQTHQNKKENIYITHTYLLPLSDRGRKPLI